MRLKKIHVREFQSIRDSNEFEVGDITCFVGKNEAGKTALFKALYKLNPIIEAEGTFSVTDDYPRWTVEDYRLAVEKNERPPAIVTTATFELDRDDINVVAESYGPKALADANFVLSKGYSNELQLHVSLSVPDILAYLANQHEITQEVAANVQATDNIAAAVEVLAKAEQNEAVKKLHSILTPHAAPDALAKHVCKMLLLPRVPKFLYFDEYYQMVGYANIEELKKRKDQKQLLRSDS